MLFLLLSKGLGETLALGHAVTPHQETTGIAAWRCSSSSCVQGCAEAEQSLLQVFRMDW